MALQIRRGTQAQLITFVPAMGEPIFTEDTKRLYIGDGITPGGIDITVEGGIGGILSSNLVLNNNSIVGFGEIVITGLIKTDGIFEGNLVGNLTGSVYANGSTLLVDAENGLVPAEVVQGIFTGTLAGDTVSPLDESLILDAANAILYGSVIGNVTGNITGNVTGNVTGSVFSNDSILMIDAENTNISNGFITIDQFNINCSQSINFQTDVLAGGTSVSITLNSSSTTQGSILSGAGGIQRVDLITYGGTKDNRQDIVSGDIFGSLSFMGIQSSTEAESITFIGVQADPNGQATPTHIASKLFIAVQPETESKAIAGQFPFLTFDCFGRLAVNQENAQATCDINGVMRLAPQNTAPSTVVEGMIAIADRVNWDPASAGSGGSYPAYYNGTSWIKMI